MVGFDEWARYSKYYINGGRTEKFELQRDLMFRNDAGKVFVVPEGTISDLGSIPRFLWPICPRDDFPSAYFLHDMLCEGEFARVFADQMLLEALKASHAPNYKAMIVYSGVRGYAVVKRLK